ncbi:MAG: hypothetical protein AAGK97_18915, partial [Bacteroidota bacterium]
MKLSRVFLVLLLVIGYQSISSQVIKVINNRVGINNTNPSYPLHVSGDTYANFYRINGSAGLYSQSHGIYFQPINASYWITRSNRGLIVRNRAGTNKGILYHNGANGFGLLDGDANWAVRIERDNYTGFYINNSLKMQLFSNGRLNLQGAADATPSANTGVLQIQGRLRLDGNEIITNSGSTLFLQFDNAGDLNVDNGSLLVDASTNRIRAYRID